MIRLEITDPTTGKTYVPHLSASLSFEMIRENPLFTRRGDYTYDIDISLEDPHNRAIYQHIDRLTANGRPQNRKARLLSDGHVIADGTEVILKKEGGILKVQILAGNSEMNYLTADDNLRIREMSFGSIPTPTNETAAGSSMQVFPDVYYAFPMSIRDINAEPKDADEDGSIDTEEYEKSLREKYFNICAYSGSTHKMQYAEGTALRPYPFVLYIIEKFINLLGYTVKSNALRNDPRWCRLILVHGYETLNIAEMLPDWTATELLEEIEKFFNCVILINQITKEAEIRSYQNFLSESSLVTITDEDVLDEFEREYEVEDAGFLHNHEGIAYELPNGEYWARTNLDSTVEKLCTRMTASYEQVGRVRGEGMTVEETNWKIFKLPNRDVEFVRVNSFVEDNWVSEAYWFYIRYFVNQFKPYGIEERTTLKIIPVRTEYGFYESSVRILPMTEELEMIGDLTFKEVIGSKAVEQTVGNMQVCFYTPEALAIGVEYENNPNSRRTYTANFPIANCVTAQDYLEESIHGIPVHIPDALPSYLQDMTLELNGEHGLYNTHFASNRIANMDEASTIRLRVSPILDPASKFLIHGRLFVCQQLKYTYANGHQDPVVEGIFYPYI